MLLRLLRLGGSRIDDVDDDDDDDGSIQQSVASEQQNEYLFQPQFHFYSARPWFFAVFCFSGAKSIEHFQVKRSCHKWLSTVMTKSLYVSSNGCFECFLFLTYANLTIMLILNTLTLRKFWNDMLSLLDFGRLRSGCGSVSRAVTSDTRDPRFKSRHRQNFIYQLYITKYKNKEKEAGNGHLKKKFWS